MTPDQLEAAGYIHMPINGGRLHDYAKAIDRHHEAFEFGGFDLLVRFGEWRSVPFIVYLKFPGYMYRLQHIQTIDHLEQLYALLRKPESTS